MRKEILLLGILFIGLLLICHRQYGEGFLDFPDQTLASQPKYAGVTNITNLLNPSFSLSKSDINTITRSIDAKPSSNTYRLQSIMPVTSLNDTPTAIKAATSCEQATASCSAFDDPVFAANCGISFDVNGTDAKGATHMGGLYLSPMDRRQQTKKAANVVEKGEPPYDPYNVYQPTLGMASKGTFGITKDGCTVVKEKVDCAAKQTFGSPNCSQCYTSGAFARVGPETGRLPSTLYVVGKGTSLIGSADNSFIPLSTVTLLPDAPTKITIPAHAEGKKFIIKGGKYVAGYIEGSTPSGTFKIDITSLVHGTDAGQGKKPRISGTTKINGFKCINAIPDSGKKDVVISYMIPFSFLNTYDSDALTCSNGPIITQEASATFLESDPCFGKANKPGNYKLECLQTRWVELGGTQQGTGYPTTQALANAIQLDANGNPLTIDAIVDNLSIIMTKALTGKDGATPLSIPEWNKVSMFATGVPINTPCDGPGIGSQACASYVFLNQGNTSHVGATYTAPSIYATNKVDGFSNRATLPEGYLNQKGLPEGYLTQKGLPEGYENAPNPVIFNQPGTELDPNTPSGLAFAEQYGTDISRLKGAYNSIVTVANDNSKKNVQRAGQLKQTYNIKLKAPTLDSNNFDVGLDGTSRSSYTEMKAICEAKGKRLCQSSEICDRSRKVIQPELSTAFPKDNWIAVGDSDNEWLTLAQYNDVPGGRYCKTHTEVAGGKPGWGNDQSGGWMRLAKCCDGTAATLGRYILLQYDHVESLNLAQIAVYTDGSTSSNVITPQTVVRKSSGYHGDGYPVQNFVDGVGNSFVHTSGGDVPWIQVDLGKVTPIQRIVVTNRKDCCQSRILGTKLYISADGMPGNIYESNKITSVNATYTWIPPDKTVYGDVVNGSTPPPRQKVYGNNGSTTCERYCSGVGSGPWNNELPREWNGARCDDVAPVIGNCYSNFTAHSGAPCTCVKTGAGWRAGGWVPN